MLYSKILRLLCFYAAATAVLGSGFGGRHVGNLYQVQRSSHGGSDDHGENLSHDRSSTYDGTVTTTLGYYSGKGSGDSSKGGKKHGPDVEYEYIPGPEHDAKSGKKGSSRNHHAPAPSSSEQHHHHGKGKNKGQPHHTPAPTPTETHYPSGKGKGGSQDSSKKGKRGSQDSSKSSKKGKGDNGDSGKGGKKGGYYPTAAPHHESPVHAPSNSRDVPSSRPPSPISEPSMPSIPGEPTNLPNPFTPSPTDEGSEVFDLSPFALLYELESPRQASRFDLAELTDVTRLYLEQFFIAEFDKTQLTILDDFITRMITSTYVMGAPYVVDYSATARFSPFSEIVPTIRQLDESLAIAFAGQNMVEYTRRLQEDLSATNAFRGAQVFFEAEPLRVSEKQKNNSATIAAAAVAATLIAAGVVLYKRRSQDTDGNKDLSKAPGDTTVAGETYTGETFDGTASVCGASFDNISRYRDEEEGMKELNTMGTIKEDTDGSNSLQPAWKVSPSYDDDDEGDEDDEDDEEHDRPVPGMMSVGSAYDEDSHALSSASEHEYVKNSEVDNEDDRSTVSHSQSFNEMALLGLSTIGGKRAQDDSCETHTDNQFEERQSSTNRGGEHFTEDARPEIASLLSHDTLDSDSNTSSKSISDKSMSSQRPRTIAEIEEMLSAENNDEETSQCFASRSHSFTTEESSFAPSQRPRTVQEIESLLSVGLDDNSVASSNSIDLD